MHAIYLFDSEKGGVGKSLMCRAFLQYLIDRNVDAFKLFEADLSNKDVMRSYQDAVDTELVEISLDPALVGEPDRIFAAAIEHDVVVNLPANVSTAFDAWLSKTGVLDMQKTEGIRFVKFFLMSNDISCCRALQRSLEQWGDQMQHVVVPNVHFFPEEYYEEIFSEPDLAALLKKYNVPHMYLQRLAPHVVTELCSLGASLGDARDSLASILNRNRIKVWLKGVYESLDSLKVSPQAIKGKDADESKPAKSKSVKSTKPAQQKAATSS